jgi:hypothetical protein
MVFIAAPRLPLSFTQMARDRGFNIDEENIEQTFEQFQTKYKDQAPGEDDLSFVVIRDDGGEQLSRPPPAFSLACCLFLCLRKGTLAGRVRALGHLLAL